MSACDLGHVFVNGTCSCGATMLVADRPTYTDDVVAVMRDTISAQRETIAAQRRTIAELERTLEEGAESLTLAKAMLAASPLPEGM